MSAYLCLGTLESTMMDDPILDNTLTPPRNRLTYPHRMTSFLGRLYMMLWLGEVFDMDVRWDDIIEIPGQYFYDYMASY